MRRKPPAPGAMQSRAAARKDGTAAAAADDDEESSLLPGRKAAPPAGAAAGGGGTWQAEAAARCKPGLAWAIAFIFVGWPFLRHFHLVPSVVWRLLTAAGLGALAHRLLTFKRWGDEHRYVMRFLVCFLIMIAELLFENCMVWIVSATDLRKYDTVPALQDNAEIVFRSLAGRGHALRWALYGDWVHTKEFLGAVLAVAFSVAYDQIPYSGFGLMSRFCLAVTLGRLLRVLCFMTTVLPNPRPGCYSRRFPPPPDTAWEMIRVGFTTLRGMGGCNDLIFSGHGAFWTLAPCALGSYYPGRRWPLALVWVALVQTSIRDFLEHMHYSIDMLVAVIVTSAVWGWLRRIYPEHDLLPRRPEGAPADKSNPFVLGLVAFGIFTAAVVILIAKA